MEWIIWLIVIVAIVAIVWGLLNRNSRSSTGTPDAGTEVGTGTAAGPAASEPRESMQRDTHDGALSGGSAAASAAAAATTGMPTAAGFSNAEPEAPTTAEDSRTGRAAAGPAQEPGEAPVSTPAPAGTGAPGEWETQWSETPPAEETHPPAHHEPARGGTGATAATATASAPSAAPVTPVHHPEYTESHAPTLPGAESAAAEADAEAETAQSARSSAAVETAASHTAEPSGHLAQDQPYGEGSAAPAADGSGPAGFTVKGSASTMTYYDETSAGYEDTRAEVWFLSEAHAEAAGFRPPRRTRQ